MVVGARDDRKKTKNERWMIERSNMSNRLMGCEMEQMGEMKRELKFLRDPLNRQTSLFDWKQYFRRLQMISSCYSCLQIACKPLMSFEVLA